MIRKLTEQDYQEIMDFVSKEAALNLFIIGDIENYGFESDAQELWGSFDKDNKIRGVLLRYKVNFIPYYDKDIFINLKDNHEEFKSMLEDIYAFRSIIESYPGHKIISGIEHIVNHFDGVLEDPKVKNFYFCELTKANTLVKDTDVVKLATEDDGKKIVDIMSSITEFRDTTNLEEESIKKDIRNKHKRAYYIENESNEIVSIAQTTAENSKSAMVVGVATKEKYRNQGLMRKCLSKLCQDLLIEGKSLCLFYDNPTAGKIYHSVGFNTIGTWTMLIGKKDNE